MNRFWTAHKNKIMNILAVAGPVVAAVVSGGVFTVPVLITAVSVIAGKLAQTPLAPPVSTHVQDVIKDQRP